MSKLSKKAQKILDRKYLANPNEDWNKVCIRIAEHVSKAEKEEERLEWFAKFYQIINEQVLIPGGRIIANAGTNVNNLSNCFVLPLEDSRKSIYKTLSMAADIFSQGGGIGYSFSELREKDRPLSTGAGASGPIAFMKLFNDTGDLIQQYSRRAAQMGFLDCTHPDVFEFIRSKAILSNENKRLEKEFMSYSGTDKRNKEYQVLHRLLLDNQLIYFNISVMLTDKFMEACKEDSDWDLLSPKTGEVLKTVKANDLLDAVAQRAWESGDPGVGFFDRINKDHITREIVGDIVSSNPCAEQFLPGYGNCLLASINLHKFYEEETNSVNFEFLEYAVRTGVRFLDDAVDMTHVGIPEIDEFTKNERRIGLGLMGWADLLGELEIPYDSEQGRNLAEYISWFVSFFALLESNAIAEEKGEFPFMDREKINLGQLDRLLHSKFSQSKFDVQSFKLRNVSVTNIPPTGSIALLCDVNSGIEPFFLLGYKRNITAGEGNTAVDSIIEVNEIFLKKLQKHGLTEEEISKIKEQLVKKGSVQHIENVPQKLKDVFKTSHEISWKDHIRMLASFQEFVTNSISKTVNMPKESTVEEVKEAIIFGWEQGVKSLALYRDKSKVFQILDTIDSK